MAAGLGSRLIGTEIHRLTARRYDRFLINSRQGWRATAGRAHHAVVENPSDLTDARITGRIIISAESVALTKLAYRRRSGALVISTG